MERRGSLNKVGWPAVNHTTQYAKWAIQRTCSYRPNSLSQLTVNSELYTQ